MGLFLFFCGKVYIVMYFFVSIRFHIGYFLDLPLSVSGSAYFFLYKMRAKMSMWQDGLLSLTAFIM